MARGLISWRTSLALLRSASKSSPPRLLRKVRPPLLASSRRLPPQLPLLRARLLLPPLPTQRHLFLLPEGEGRQAVGFPRGLVGRLRMRKPVASGNRTIWIAEGLDPSYLSVFDVG